MDHLTKQTRCTPDSASRPPEGGGTRIRVFCLPHAGGSASSYTPWARAGWPPDLEFVPVHLPGRPGRMAQAMPADMNCVVTDVLDAMWPTLAGPFVIFGHSMGGLIAYEVARRLAKTGPYPECLIVSGTGSPDTADPVPVTDMTDQELTDWLIRLGGTPSQVLSHPDLLLVALRALRADLALLERYGAPEPTAIPVPIAAFGGREDTRAPAWKIERWQAATSRGFEMRIFPGGHFYLHERQEAVLTEIARVVRARAAGTAMPG